jgi:DNA repair exonuclease SbcCD ATPase subunit
MGWLKKVLGMGEEGENAESEAVSQQTIGLAKLAAWVETRQDREFGSIKPKIEEQFKLLLEEKHKLFTKLEELGTAQLQNPQIPEREKQIMEGNRNAYISHHKQFINMLTVSEAVTCKETTFFCKNFEELVVKLAQSTAKGHYVMKEFFADHAAKINKSIKIMGDAVTKMKELLEDSNLSISGTDELTQKITELKNKRKLLTESDEELETLKTKLANSEQLKKKLLKSIEQLKKTDSYNEFQEANKEREEMWRELKRTDEEIATMFSQLDRPMRKFERMLFEDVETLKRYNENAMKALCDDTQLKILPILEKMKKAVEDESLGLKDKEKEKALERMAQITAEKLTESRKRYLETKHSIKTIDDKIIQNNVLQEINDQQYKIDHTENQIKILNDKIDKLGKTKEKIDLEKIRGELQQMIQDSLGLEVKIAWQDSHTA